MIDDKYLTP